MRGSGRVALELPADIVWLSNEVSACRGLACGLAHKRDVLVLRIRSADRGFPNR